MTKILRNADDNIRLELRDDRLSAWLTVLDQGRLIDESEILELIDSAGIKSGFEEAQKYIRKHGLEREFNTPFPIALCNRVQGEAQLNYYFDLEQAKNFDGSVSLEDLPQLTCIEAGAVLADFSSNIFDRQGSIYDIYGEMLQDEKIDPEAARQLLGENVALDSSRAQLIAQKAGYVRVADDGKISILDRISLDGDIEDFPGGLRTPMSLEIRGTVKQTAITTAGDLTIRGSLISSSIYCEGNLEVQGEIRNCRLPGLQVLGNLSCRGILASQVLCRGKINFHSKILGSEVAADGGIYSGTGSISGGHIASCGNIELENLGAREGLKTELEITINPFHKALLLQLTKDLIHLKQDALGNAEQIEELNGQIAACESELDRGLNEFLRRPPEEKLSLKVRRDVYPPVQIRILKHEYQIHNPQTRLELIEQD